MSKRCVLLVQSICWLWSSGYVASELILEACCLRNLSVLTPHNDFQSLCSCLMSRRPRSRPTCLVLCEPLGIEVEAPTHRMITAANGCLGGHGRHGWPGVSWGYLWVSEMCVSHWRTILWSSRDAGTPPKNGFVPENSAQGDSLMERRTRFQNTCHCTEEHGDGLPSHLWNQSVLWSIKLPLREKWLIGTNSFTYLLRFSVKFLWVKLPWKYSHFSMNSTLFIYFCRR